MLAAVPLLNRYFDEPLFVVVHTVLLIWSFVVVVQAVNFRRRLAGTVGSLASASGSAASVESQSRQVVSVVPEQVRDALDSEGAE